MKISAKRALMLGSIVMGSIATLPAPAPAAGANAPYVLPFDPISPTVLAAGPRKVFAHWHEFPFRYYGSNGYASALNPAGFGSAYFGSGSVMRNQPIPLPQSVTATYVTTYAQAEQDLLSDVTLAAQIGIDAFLLNCWYGPEDFRWRAQMIGMFDAADTYSSQNPAGFAVVPNIDSYIMAARLQQNPNDPVAVPETVADNFATFKTRRSFMKMGSRYVIGAFGVEALPLTRYRRFLDRLHNAHNMDVYFTGVFVDPTQRANYAPILQLYSRWSVDPYSQVSSEAADKSWANKLGIGFMSDVSQSYDRPLSFIASETGGFQTEINTWTRAISDGAQAVNIITWNDHSEGTNLRPNTGSQYAFYDIAAYYIAWYKTGVKPAITRDVLYYSHRMHPTTAAPDTTKQATPYKSKNNFPLENKVYLVGFLTKAATMEIRSGGKLYQQAADPGIQAMSAPLAANDLPQFMLVRNKQTTISMLSAFQTRAGDMWQDLLYRAGGSTRSPVATAENSLPENRWTHLRSDTDVQ